MKTDRMRTIFIPILMSAASLWGSDARAAYIQYEVELAPTATTSHRYTFTVINDGLLPDGAAVRGFGIEFDNTLYEESSLSIVDEPTGWSSIFLAPVDPDIDEPAYDWTTADTGVTAGDSLTGFVVAFNWLGTGEPGSQPYYVYDPDTFETLQTGMTTLVPLPPAATLSVLSIAMLSFFLRNTRPEREVEGVRGIHTSHAKQTATGQGFSASSTDSPATRCEADQRLFSGAR